MVLSGSEDGTVREVDVRVRPPPLNRTQELQPASEDYHILGAPLRRLRLLALQTRCFDGGGPLHCVWLELRGTLQVPECRVLPMLGYTPLQTDSPLGGNACLAAACVCPAGPTQHQLPTCRSACTWLCSGPAGGARWAVQDQGGDQLHCCGRTQALADPDGRYDMTAIFRNALAVS